MQNIEKFLKKAIDIVNAKAIVAFFQLKKYKHWITDYRNNNMVISFITTTGYLTVYVDYRDYSVLRLSYLASHINSPNKNMFKATGNFNSLNEVYDLVEFYSREDLSEYE